MCESAQCVCGVRIALLLGNAAARTPGRIRVSVYPMVRPEFICVYVNGHRDGVTGLLRPPSSALLRARLCRRAVTLCVWQCVCVGESCAWLVILCGAAA